MRKDDVDDTQAILGEMRRLRSAQEAIAHQVSVETPWVRVREHVDYGLRVLQKIPLMARVFVFLGVCALGASAVFRNLRLFFIALDLLFASLLFVGGP